MKKLNAVITMIALITIGAGNAYAANSEPTQLQQVNAQLTTALEQYASNSSICGEFDFTSIGDQVNAAVNAGIAAGNSDASFDAQEAGKGLKLLMKHCASNDSVTAE